MNPFATISVSRHAIERAVERGVVDVPRPIRHLGEQAAAIIRRDVRLGIILGRVCEKKPEWLRLSAGGQWEAVPGRRFVWTPYVDARGRTVVDFAYVVEEDGGAGDALGVRTVLVAREPLVLG